MYLIGGVGLAALLLGWMVRRVLHRQRIGALRWRVNASAKAFQRDVAAYFAIRGWTVAPAAKARFVVSKGGLRLLIFLGPDIYDRKFKHAEWGGFGQDIQRILRSSDRSLPILVVVRDIDMMEHFDPARYVPASFIYWRDLHDIGYLELVDTRWLDVKASCPSWLLTVVCNNARMSRQISRQELRSGDGQAAVQWADKAVSADPSDPNCYDALAEALLMINDLEGAGRAVDRALFMAPDEPRLLRRKSEIEFRSGQTVVAMRWAERALAAAPADPMGYHHLAWLHMRSNDLAAAAAAEGKALAMSPANAAFVRAMNEITARMT